MKAAGVQQRLWVHAARTSGHDPHRYDGYLGMSQISREEDELVRMLQGEVVWRPTRHQHLRLRLGHLFEDYVKGLLVGAGLCEEQDVWDLGGEVVAEFDERFRGHIDGVFPDGSLLEIKSTFSGKLGRLKRKGYVPTRVYQQVQMYLAHGGFEKGYVVWMARDTGEVLVQPVTPNPDVIERLNAKAKRVLRRVDMLAEGQAA